MRVTKQQFIDTFLARYKRVYNHHPSEQIVKDVIEDYKMQYDALETEGFVLVDKKALSSPELLERLAALEHEQWGEWIKRMDSLKVIVDVPIREMWLKLACTPYEKLTEKGKESDRVFARKVLREVLGK